MNKIILLNIFCLFLTLGLAQDLEPFSIDENWLTSIENAAPNKTSALFKEKRKILVFSKATGFDHWCIPHNAEMLKILGKKSNAFEIYIGYDIENFKKKNLKKYDAVILNNSNPSPQDRDLFSDLLIQNTTLTKAEIMKKKKVYEQNLLSYVSKGGGLMILHGAITVQNNSEEFSKMTGGSFDYHPKQQSIHVKEVDQKHPLVKAFKDNGFVHLDEPYFFKNAYFDFNFRPLLYMEVDELEGLKKETKEEIVYLSWIKKYGRGRVFYSAPSHNAQSFENPELLQFLLDGMQYVVGDLQCDDSPFKKP